MIENTDIRHLDFSDIIPATFGLIALMDEHQKDMDSIVKQAPYPTSNAPTHKP